MCLAALEARLIPGSRVVDLGSGSGVLSIAALRLGAACAVGVDIDPKAEDMARENGAYNGMSTPQVPGLHRRCCRRPQGSGGADGRKEALLTWPSSIL